LKAFFCTFNKSLISIYFFISGVTDKDNNKNKKYLLRYVILQVGLDTQFIDAMPTALMKPFSGSGARAMMVDTMQTFGADSFAGRLSSIVQGSTETTFYVLSAYFGAVGIKNIRHALACGIIADFAGITAAIFIAYWFFA
jgi:spore maturation protein SpmB